MLNAENAQLKPNILTQTAEEEEQQRKKKEGKLLRDRTNRARNQRREQKSNELPKFKPQQKYTEIPFDLGQFSQQKQNMPEKQLQLQKTQNIFINFDSDNNQDEQSTKIQQKHPEELKDNQKELIQNQYEKDLYRAEHKLSTMNQKEFLIALSSDQQQQSQYQGNIKEHCTPQTQLNASENVIQSTFSNKEVLFNISFDDDQKQQSKQSEQEKQQSSSQSSSESEEQQEHSNQSHIVNLSHLIEKYKDLYYLSPIPQHQVFQCVVKRQRTQAYTRYHLYDRQTLRNFITVLKLDDYMVVSKYDSVSSRYIHDPTRKQKIVARISPNFFGTVFNCSIQSRQIKSNDNYPPPQKKQRIITIQYQTNILGLNGPRKMSAYIGDGSYHYPLNEIYKKQQAKQKQIQMYKNKIPKWCSESNSYVLNFNGRATVSSIKNFILISQHEKDSDIPRVLFGKFGKQLFNLDIRYPFNILQGVSLAISSFHKKLGCQ